MEKWRNHKDEESRQREERFKRLKERDKSEAAVKPPEKSDKNIVSSYAESSILTPVNAYVSTNTKKSTPSNFNFSDFEDDNSSPFDNMELKTINDMEVLASVLGTTSVDTSRSQQTSPPSNMSHYKNGITWNGWSDYGQTSGSQYYGQSLPNQAASSVNNFYSPNPYTAGHVSWGQGYQPMPSVVSQHHPVESTSYSSSEFLSLS